MAGGTANQLSDHDYQRQQQQDEHESSNSMPPLPGGFPHRPYQNTTALSRETGGNTAGGSGSSSSNSRVSIAQLVNGGTEAVDHSMVEAAETLGALRRPSGGDSHGVQFIQRVQAIPLVNSAIGMYDRTRQSSRLVRVGSNVIESGVRRMCEPITKRIDVAQLDSFACRQLDNLGYTSERQQAEQPGQAGQAATGSSSNLRKRTKDQAQADDMDVMDDVDSSNGKNKYYDGRNELEAPLLPPRPQQLRQQQQQQQQQQQATNGKWRVANLVATARERALAVREDSMRRLKYCLDWVAYATALVGQHMHALRQLLNALQQASRTAFYSHGGSGAAEPAVVRADEADGGAAVRRIHEAGVELARARREIVAAVRRAVGVVSHYAGSVLPGEARRQVRALVLGLPRRLGAADPSMMHPAPDGSSTRGSPSVASSCNSPFASPRHTPLGGDLSAANIEATARRTLTFASESFVMLDAMRAVFGNLYANAERWIGAPAAAGDAGMPAEERVMSEPAEPAEERLAGYREQRSESSVSLPAVVRRPPRRLPLNMTPVADAAPAHGGAEAPSMVEIGEQMRLMDMAALRHRRARSTASSMDNAGSDASAAGSRYYVNGGGGGVSAVDADDAVAHKRNRTREPTPTRM